MVRIYGRTIIGLLACLLMQIGLITGASPVQARSHEARTMMISCHDKAKMQCHGAHHALHAVTVHHHEKCCDVHAASSDIPPPAAPVMVAYAPVISSLPFLVSRSTGFVGADRLPLLPPPKISTF
ncbi:hypothetical protein K6W36_11235 [Acetobacter senegalensis]|uniref:hypothetical protein n=1 Tax=Acetobacter senegalensis TaxID=446692 RepID=UPI001EDC2F83|nr:hypothetical protein [Acetobacter senegalensis]MCG4261142.1 hypothetical protein [Acetobacter senegalensis]